METTKTVSAILLITGIAMIIAASYAQAVELICLLGVIGILMAAGSYVIIEYCEGAEDEEEYIQQEVDRRVRNELAAREERRRATSEQRHEWRWWEV